MAVREPPPKSLDNFEDLYKNLLSVLEVEMQNSENIKLN